MMAAVAAKAIIVLRIMTASSSLRETGRALCWNRAAQCGAFYAPRLQAKISMTESIGQERDRLK
jgi:hypothetical protein